MTYAQYVTVAPNRPRTAGTAAVASDLRVAITRLSRRLRAQRGAADLPEGQFVILSTLWRHGPMAPGALAEHEGVRPPSMTRAVNALCELGLVRKVGNPDDGRGVLVELTDAGRADVVETRRRRDAWLTRQLAALPPEDRATVARAAVLLSGMGER